MSIRLATPEEHLAGANYLVTINSRDTYAAETVQEAWEIIGRQHMGACHMVTSPMGLDVDEFIPY